MTGTPVMLQGYACTVVGYRKARWWAGKGWVLWLAVAAFCLGRVLP